MIIMVIWLIDMTMIIILVSGVYQLYLIHVMFPLFLSSYSIANCGPSRLKIAKSTTNFGCRKTAYQWDFWDFYHLSTDAAHLQQLNIAQRSRLVTQLVHYFTQVLELGIQSAHTALFILKGSDGNSRGSSI